MRLKTNNKQVKHQELEAEDGAEMWLIFTTIFKEKSHMWAAGRRGDC